MIIPNKLIIFLFFFVLTFADFLPERLDIIDAKKDSFIVRGNLPVKDNKFQMKELKEELSQLTGLEEFDLVIVSLMNFLTAKETRNRYIEEKYIESHPKQAKYLNKWILGSLISPSGLPKLFRKMATKIYDYLGIDDMQDFIDELNTLLTKNKKPTIIYVHCSAGVDRTGYVSAAYRMKFKKRTLKQALLENKSFFADLKRTMHFNTINGLKWFCLTLGRNEEECQLKPDSNNI